MGLRSAVADRAFSWVARYSTRADVPRYAPAWLTEIIALHPEWSVKKAIKEGYKAHFAVYTVASDLADCVRQPPWVLKRRTKTGSELVDQHPLASMIRSPNPENSWGELCEAWDIYKSLAGNGYGTHVIAGETAQMWMLRPDRMAIKLITEGPMQGHLAGYDYSVDGDKPDFYPIEQVHHFKFFDPSQDYLGLSPLQAAARLVDTSSAGMEWNFQSMSNRARPDGMLSPKEPLSKPQYELYRKMIDETIAGPKNAKKIIIPSAPADFVAFELSPIEMDFLNSFSTYEKAIYKAYKVHPEALGTEAKFENKRWAVRAKWEGPVFSRLREMRGRLNHRFGPIYGTAYPPAVGDLYLDFDLSNTPAMLAARRENAEEGERYWKMGTPFNLISEELNLPFDPIPGGDVGYIPATYLPVTGGGERGLATRGVNIETDEQFEYHWRAIDRQRQAFTNGVTARVRERFDVERKVVIKAIKDGQRDLDLVIDSQADAWSKLLTAACRAVIEYFGEQTAKELSVGESAVGRVRMGLESRNSFREHRYVFDPWSALIQGFVAAKVAKDVQHVTDTTKRTIRTAVREGLDANEGSVQIAKRVEGIYSDKWMGEWGYIPSPGECKYRCAVIARTEVHSAAGFAMHESARQSGVVEEKHWYDSGDERVRDSHVAATAEGWIPFNQVFSNGCMYPGEGPGDEVILCRCVEAFRTRGR